MTIDLYRPGSPPTLEETLKPDEGSELRQKIFGEDILSITLDSNSILDIQILDYVEYDGRKYQINNLPIIDKVATNYFKYTITLEAIHYDLGKIIFRDAGGVASDSNTEFYFTGDLEDVLDLIIANLAGYYTGDELWTKDTCVSTDVRNHKFTNETLLQVLQRMREEYETEYEFDYNLVTPYKKISYVATAGSDPSVSLEYKSGTRGITRTIVDSKNMVTRLFVYGSQKNLDSSYRSGVYTRLTFQGKTIPLFPGSKTKNASTYGYNEKVVILEDIFPRFEGTIDYTAGALTDTIIIRDNTIDFDINSYLISGETASIYFRSGTLSGYEFDIASYDAVTKYIYLIPKTERGERLPSATQKPAVGDTFTILNITMPQAYIDAAELELSDAADDLMTLEGVPRVKYEIDPDWTYFRTNTINPELADQITVVDTDFGVNYKTRILSLRRSLTNEWDYDLELSDYIAQPVQTEQSKDIHYLKMGSEAAAFKSGGGGGVPLTPFEGYRSGSEAVTPGANGVTFSSSFPFGSTYDIFTKLVTADGWSIGGVVSGETISGFDITVEENATLTYFAIIRL